MKIVLSTQQIAKAIVLMLRREGHLPSPTSLHVNFLRVEIFGKDSVVAEVTTGAHMPLPDNVYRLSDYRKDP